MKPKAQKSVMIYFFSSISPEPKLPHLKRSAAMSTNSRPGPGLSLFLIIMFLIPVGLIMVVAEESPFHQVSGEPGI
jgi:hypothetical protein